MVYTPNKKKVLKTSFWVDLDAQRLSILEGKLSEFLNSNYFDAKRIRILKPVNPDLLSTVHLFLAYLCLQCAPWGWLFWGSLKLCLCLFFFFLLLKLSLSAPCNGALVILSSGLPHMASALGLVLVGCESSPCADLEAADPGSCSDSALTRIRVILGEFCNLFFCSVSYL